MGGFFGVVSKVDAISDVFFGTDYHSHLGTRRAGMAAYDSEIGFQRDIHNIQNKCFEYCELESEPIHFSAYYLLQLTYYPPLITPST